MKAITKASRVNTALQVIQHMNEGMSVVEACQIVGIPRSSYYYILKNNPEAIAEIHALVDTHNREQLLLILTNKTEILQKLIDTALADTTKPKERLAIYKTLNEIMDNFMRDLQLESKLEKGAKALLLNGPNLVPGKSKFTATERSVTFETES
jgi:ACT domain-containing protein